MGFNSAFKGLSDSVIRKNYVAKYINKEPEQDKTHKEVWLLRNTSPSFSIRHRK